MEGGKKIVDEKEIRIPNLKRLLKEDFMA